MIEAELKNGFGIGLRSVYYQDFLNTDSLVDWLEIISEDYLVAGGMPLAYLDQIRERYPIAMHGVSMSLGSADPLNWNYLSALKKLARRVNPLWISDHCCWTGVDAINLHDLLPLPYTHEVIRHLVTRIREVQDFLGCRILIENVSSYISYQHSEMTEWDFLNAILEEADCYLLLDINNVYVSAFNHHFDPCDYINKILPHRVRQFHLAGHKRYPTHIVDTHDREISDAVWNLYRIAVHRFKNVPTLIEWDSAFPPLKTLLQEVEKARYITDKITTGM